jgi:hypothetical protein
LPVLDLEGAGPIRTLGVGAIAEMAQRPASLQALLLEAGVDAAAERTWADRTSAVQIVTVRAVRFDDAEGARRYTDWLGVHGAEVYHHEPDACCPNKDTTWLLSTWQEGDVVWTVQIGGPGADRAALSDILEEVA